jgi:predicted dinucleotide-binding enzyme
VEELGFVAVDSGSLKRGRLVDRLADFVAHQIGAMGLGLNATISIHVIPAVDHEVRTVAS